MDKDPAEMPTASQESTEPAAPQEGAFEGDTDAAERELYAGDTGTLPALTRQVLVHLLKGPFFERSRSERLWQELKVREEIIRSRLSDLYLDLLVDDELGVAFCRKPDLGDHDAPSLLNTVRLRFLDSAVLLELRDQLMRARANGERAVVTRADVAELLRLFDRSAGTNDRIFQQHFKAIIKRLTERRILLTLKSAALQKEYEALQAQKEVLYADYGKLKKKVREYDVIKQNIDSILQTGKQPERGKEAERG